MKKNGSFYRKIFRDISLGHSQASLDGKDVFIKHLSPIDQVDLEDIYDTYYEEARERGMPSEEEMLKFLIEEKEWSESDEKYIKDQTIFVESLIASKKHLVLKSKKEAKDKIIEQEKEKLQKKIDTRSSLIGHTCESYAENRVNDFYIIKSFYNDSDLNNQLFSKEEYDEIDQKDLYKIINIYNKEFIRFKEVEIYHLILSDFYQVYFPFCEDCIQFYGKPICFITNNQIKLITYTKIFKHILETNQNIPESILSDPEALLDYGTTSESAKESIKSKLDKDGATTVFGATKEDYKYLGVDMDNENKKVSLYEEAKKNGGSLSMQDLIKLSGQ